MNNEHRSTLPPNILSPPHHTSVCCEYPKFPQFTRIFGGSIFVSDIFIFTADVMTIYFISRCTLKVDWLSSLRLTTWCESDHGILLFEITENSFLEIFWLCKSQEWLNRCPKISPVKGLPTLLSTTSG